MTPLSSARTTSSLHFPIILIALVAVMATSTGCGSSGSSSSAGGGQKLRGSANIELLLASAANDQLAEFGMVFPGLTLTSQSGKTVNLLPAKPLAAT